MTLPSRHWRLITGRQRTATLVTLPQTDGSLKYSFLLWDGGTGQPDDLTGKWDDGTEELTFDQQYDPRSVDNYDGYVVVNPIDGTVGLAGTVNSYADSPNPEVNGWYALAEPSFDSEDSGFQVPTLMAGESPDVPTGNWQIIAGVTWNRLVLNIDASGTVTGSLGAAPVTGSWDPDLGQLQFRIDYDARTYATYTGYAILNYLGQVVALAGLLQEYADGSADFTGWYATRQHSRTILETDWPNGTGADTSNVNWSSILVGAKRFLLNDTPIFEWVPVTIPEPRKNDLYGRSEAETSRLNEEPDLYAVCGWVVDAHVSQEDLPFSHPFGNQKDYNFDIAPDTPYLPLLAVSNIDLRKRAPWFRYDPEMAAGMDVATAVGPDELNLDVPGLMHVEIDSALIPDRFRPTVGDRVIVFGRWIVDAGHDDFGTEIHPTLLTVRAFQPTLDDSRGTPDTDTTICTLMWCPFMVGQTYSYDSDGNPRGLRAEFEQFLRNLVYDSISTGRIDRSQQIELSAPIIPVPLYSLRSPAEPRQVSFVLRPEAPRLSQDDILLVSWSLTVRPGVHVDILIAGDDTVLVAFRFDDSYAPADIPAPTGKRTVLLTEFSPDVTKRIRDSVWKEGEQAVEDARGIPFLPGPPASTPDDLVAVVDKGALMNLYDDVPATSAADGGADVTDQPADALDIVRDRRATDGGQPRAAYGSITVRWNRAPAAQ